MPTLRQADPSRTSGIQRMFGAALVRRLAELDQAIRISIIDNDALGLSNNILLPNKVLPSDPKAWSGVTAAEKQKKFTDWLGNALAQMLEETTTGEVPAWLKTFVRAAYTRGIQTATAMLSKSRPELRQLTQQILGTPFHRERLEAIFERNFAELKGLSAQMSTKIQRALADGLLVGDNPIKIARRISEEIGISKNRARTIARTECLPGDARTTAAVIRAIFRRWYEGVMVHVETRSGRQFSATPNHPMLSQNGWISAGLLQKGDKLICDGWQEQLGAPGYQYAENRPAAISEIFDALSGFGITESAVTTHNDFHGDGVNGYVDILRPGRYLLFGTFTPIYEHAIKDVFAPSNIGGFRFCPFCTRLLPVDQTVCLCLGSDLDSRSLQSVSNREATYAEICSDLSRRISGKISAGDALAVQGHRLICRSARQSSLSDISTYGALSDFDDWCNLPTGETGFIQLDDVVDVRVSQFSGHVYNLETPYGYFNISGFYTGNTVRTNAEAQLNTFERFGVQGVELESEWLTAGDSRVCPACAEMSGKIFTIEKARGLIPLHPQCRCAWLSAIKPVEQPA